MLNEETNLFPEDYPDDLYEKIVQDGAEKNEYDVYRVAEMGINNRDAFLSTYQEPYFHKPLNNRDSFLATKNIDCYDIGDYSTSCFESSKQAKKILDLKQKHHSGPKILFGKISPEFGLSLRTSESLSKRKARPTHVDWWIYKDKDPSVNFVLVEEA